MLLLAFCFIAACAGVSSFAACFDDSSYSYNYNYSNSSNNNVDNDNNSMKFSVSSSVCNETGIVAITNTSTFLLLLLFTYFVILLWQLYVDSACGKLD